MNYILVLMIGILIGILLSKLLDVNRKTSGTFTIDVTDPMKDIFRIELSESFDDICEKKQIVFEVKKYGFDSQE